MLMEHMLQEKVSQIFAQSQVALEVFSSSVIMRAKRQGVRVLNLTRSAGTEPHLSHKSSMYTTLNSYH